MRKSLINITVTANNLSKISMCLNKTLTDLEKFFSEYNIEFKEWVFIEYSTRSILVRFEFLPICKMNKEKRDKVLDHALIELMEAKKKNNTYLIKF